MLKNLIIFGVGVAIGFGAAYYIEKKKFQKIADDEINSMAEYYKQKSNKEEKEEKEPSKSQFTAKTNDLKDLAKMYQPEDENKDVDPGYYSNPYPFVDDHPTEGPQETPYSITPEQFTNEKRNFEKVTLFYFEGNDVLTDDMERTTESIEASIGRENLDKFGEFEEDVAYIRNDRLGIDYEVIRQHATYKPPYPNGEDDIY